MKLVYLWIEESKNIQKQGFNFNGRFNCHYDDTTQTLTITEDKNYINIFPEHITMTAIVGENGSGKSSLIKHFISNINYNTISYDRRQKLACYLNHEKNQLFIHTYLNNLTVNCDFPYYIDNDNQRSFYEDDIGFEKEKFESFYYLYQPSLEMENDLYDGYEYNDKIIVHIEPNKDNKIINLLDIEKKTKSNMLHYLATQKATTFRHSSFFNPTGIYIERDDDTFYNEFPSEYDNKYNPFRTDYISNMSLLLKLDLLIYFYFNSELLKGLQPNSTLNKIKDLKNELEFEITQVSIEFNFSVLENFSYTILETINADREEIKSNHNISNDPLSLFLNEIENIFLTIQNVDTFFQLCTLDVHAGHINGYDVQMHRFTKEMVPILQHLPKFLTIGFFEENGRSLSELSSGEQNILKILYSIENIIHLRKGKT